MTHQNDQGKDFSVFPPDLVEAVLTPRIDFDQTIANLDEILAKLKERAALWEENKRMETIAKANGIERICKLELWKHPDGYRLTSMTGDRKEGIGTTIEEAMLSWLNQE